MEKDEDEKERKTEDRFHGASFFTFLLRKSLPSAIDDVLDVAARKEIFFITMHVRVCLVDGY